MLKLYQSYIKIVYRLYLNQRFFIHQFNGSNRKGSSSCLGTAGKSEEVFAGVDGEVDQVLHQVGHLGAALTRARLLTLLPTIPHNLRLQPRTWTELSIVLRAT